VINKELIKKLFLMKTKFAASSGVATLVDMGLFALLAKVTLIPVEIINIITSLVGMIVNFILQKKYIFQLNRTVRTAFILSLIVSLGGILISTSIIYGLKTILLFHTYPILAKIIATGVVFFYNFYLKRFSFEKKFL
jgi:putative flippase GtrA